MLSRRPTLLMVTTRARRGGRLLQEAAAGHRRSRPRRAAPRHRTGGRPDADAARRAEEEARLARGCVRLDPGHDLLRLRSSIFAAHRAALQTKAEALRQFPDIRIRIEGHADERGTVEYNLALGERRADAARTYLVDLGIDPDRMTTISYGEERPAMDGANEAAWSQNRRDEFVIIGG